jgi:hypothetical protein
MAAGLARMLACTDGNRSRFWRGYTKGRDYSLLKRSVGAGSWAHKPDIDRL